MENCNNLFSQRLRELRLEKGLKQQEIAVIFNVSIVTISSWELNKQEPCIDDIVKLANYFNVSTDYLLGNSEEY